jgi:ribulose-5-phosphate 4-epimerase/fuculose-1-phosphate aldolase
MHEPQSARQLLQQVGQYMMRYELAWGNAGNISVRTGEETCMISASGTFLGELNDEDVVESRFNGELVAAGSKKPSKEMPMHRAVYETRPEVNAVLHASPFYSTLIACSQVSITSEWFVETMYYLERVERVPYCHPGSKELGDKVREKAGKANILLLDNHGVLVYDTSVQEARMALQTLEMACRMFITAKHSGIDMNALSPETVGEFLNHAGYKPRRRWMA